MKSLLVVITLIGASVVVSLIAFAAHPGQADSKPNSREAKTMAAIRGVLDAQTAAWNLGDVEGFMDGYARAIDIVFVSGDSVTHESKWATLTFQVR